MKFGVNYTPRVGWFHSWLDLDLGLVAEDMAAIAELGADHVRIFPLWPLLQPNRSLIRAAAVDDVLAVVDAAGQAGLSVTVDALQGHLSSFDFLPAWVSTWHRRNLFIDAEVVSAQARLVSTLATELSGRPHAEGLSLGNEFIQFAAGRHPEAARITPAQAGAWLERLLQAARQAWPGARLTHSFDDDLWFDDAHPFQPTHAVTLGDLTTVHSWVFMAVGPRYGQGHPALRLFARYLVELARAWGGAGRPIWLQEVGAPSTHVPPGDVPDFVAGTIAHLTGLDGNPVVEELEAITWWCSHDVSRDLADFPELEHSLGLIDSAGRIKPAGQAFQDTVMRVRDATAGAADAGGADGGDGVVGQAAGGRRPVLNLPSATAERRYLSGPKGELFDRWVRAAQAGDLPALALPAQ